jgi:hypothetical protein
MPTQTRPLTKPWGVPGTTEPVTIDDQGRIMRADGSQVIAPGLEPEKVLQGLADYEAGRWTLIEGATREEFLEKLLALGEANH